MILNLFATTVAALLLFLSFSNALSLDSSVHFARHQQIAARRPPVKRSSVSARCKARSPPSVSPSSGAVAVAATVAVTTPESTPPQASPSPAPPSASPSSGKVGIAWGLTTDPSLKNFLGSKVSSIYTWTADKPPNLFGLHYCPMLWGSDTSDFKNMVKPGYADCVYGYNEPNLASQSNLDPTTAAQIWMQNVLPLSQQGYTSFFTPAVTTAPDGPNWYQTFFKACINCQFTGMNLHFYGTNSADMITYITNMHNTFNMPIQVTEFACQSFDPPQSCDSDQAFAFMSNVTQWMDQTDYITKYFAFGVMKADAVEATGVSGANALMADDGTPTPLGRLYIGS